MLKAAIFSLLLVCSAEAAARSPTPAADEAVGIARAAARQDRHADAIAAFRQAIAMAPGRQEEWVLELADQLTWSGRVDEAIALYRGATAASDPGRLRWARMGLARALSWQGDHAASIALYDRMLVDTPADLEVRLARAQVLSWANRLGEALAAYEQVLGDHPGEPEAQRGAARVLSWRGRYRRAIERLAPVIGQQPNDRQAIAIIAESLTWMGRPDRSVEVLRAQLAADPGDDRARTLLGEIEAQKRPAARADWRIYDQSDDLEITELALDARATFLDGRGSAGPRYVAALYRPPGDSVEKIRVDRFGLRGQLRLSDAFDLNASVYADVIDVRGQSGDRDIFTYETYLTFVPNDRLRFDVGSSRWTFDSEEALRAGLVATQVNASMDFLVDERTRLSARASWADYSDGNRRTWWQLQAGRRILNDPRIVLGYRYTGFDFTRPGQAGYYNPGLLHLNEVLLQASDSLGRSLRWDIRLVIGYEIEVPGSSRFTKSAGISLTWDIHRDLAVEFAYDYSTSRTQSSSGFERSIGRIAVVSRF